MNVRFPVRGTVDLDDDQPTEIFDTSGAHHVMDGVALCLGGRIEGRARFRSRVGAAAAHAGHRRRLNRQRRRHRCPERRRSRSHFDGQRLFRGCILDGGWFRLILGLELMQSLLDDPPAKKANRLQLLRRQEAAVETPHNSLVGFQKAQPLANSQALIRYDNHQTEPNVMVRLASGRG